MKQPDEVMRELGFTDHRPERWYLWRKLYRENTGSFVDAGISLNVTIDKETWEAEIDVLDDNFLQPVNFERIKTPYFENVRANYNKEIARLVNAGVLEEECHI